MSKLQLQTLLRTQPKLLLHKMAALQKHLKNKAAGSRINGSSQINNIKK